MAGKRIGARLTRTIFGDDIVSPRQRIRRLSAVAIGVAASFVAAAVFGWSAWADDTSDLSAAITTAQTKLDSYTGDKKNFTDAAVKLNLKLQPYLATRQPIDNIRDLSAQLITALGQPLDDSARAQVKPILASLSAAALKLLQQRIHVDEAWYGDLSDLNKPLAQRRRSCEATAVVRNACEGQTKCAKDPVANVPDLGVISGANLCGFEPAPLAAPGVNALFVKYRCIATDLRPWSEAVSAPGGVVSSITLRARIALMCDPNQ